MNQFFRKNFHVIMDKAKLLVVAYVLIVFILYVAQDALIFHPRKADPDTIKYLSEHPNAEALKIRAKDGNELIGWYKRAAWVDKAPVVLYFWGNAEEISDTVANWNLKWVSIAALNYRGYGESAWSPSEKDLKEDSLAFYDEMAKRPEVMSGSIRAMGWSLGSGIAAHVASERKIEKLVLLMPYDSVASVAQEIYPVIPVDLLLRNRFDTLAIAGKITAPTLVIAAENDRVIPKSHAENLVRNWHSPIESYVIPNGRHEDSFYGDEVKSKVESFLGTMTVTGRAPDKERN